MGPIYQTMNKIYIYELETELLSETNDFDIDLNSI